jgi:hypothetical protein
LRFFRVHYADDRLTRSQFAYHLFAILHYAKQTSR